MVENQHIIKVLRSAIQIVVPFFGEHYFAHVFQ